MSAPVDAGTQFARIIMKACAYDPAQRYQTPEELYGVLDDLKMEDLAESGSYKTVFRKQERIKQNHIVQLHRTAEQHRMLHQIPKMYEKVQCRIRQYRIPGEIKNIRFSEYCKKKTCCKQCSGEQLYR